MRPFALLPALAAGFAFAQATDQDWLASAQAAEFRGRVVQLALIHGESNGIDPRDYMVRTRAVAQPPGGCADVEVVTLKAGEMVRRETVRACRAH